MTWTATQTATQTVEPAVASRLVGEACRSDGTLKDASEIEWIHSPSQDSSNCGLKRKRDGSSVAESDSGVSTDDELPETKHLTAKRTSKKRIQQRNVNTDEVHRAQLSSNRAKINSSFHSDALYETPDASARPLGPTEPHAWLTLHSVHSRTLQTPTHRVYIEHFCHPQESSSQPAGSSKDVQRQVSVAVKHTWTIQYIFRLQRRLRRLMERLRSDVKSQLSRLRQIARYCQPVSSRPPQDPLLTCSVDF